METIHFSKANTPSGRLERFMEGETFTMTAEQVELGGNRFAVGRATSLSKTRCFAEAIQLTNLMGGNRKEI